MTAPTALSQPRSTDVRRLCSAHQAQLMQSTLSPGVAKTRTCRRGQAELEILVVDSIWHLKSPGPDLAQRLGTHAVVHGLVLAGDELGQLGPLRALQQIAGLLQARAQMRR